MKPTSVSPMPYVAVYCGPCGGAGHLADNKPCSICRGEGFIVLPGSIEDYRDCAGCAGSGYNGVNTNAICNRCEGIGVSRKR